MLLTAIAATVVIVSAVTDATHDRDVRDKPPAHDTQLSEQPLIGLGAGVTVREVTQDQPFSLVALTGDLAGTSTRVRAKRSDGSWGPWYQTEYQTAAPDPQPVAADRPAGSPRGPGSTDPVFVGSTKAVQIAITRPIDAVVTRAPAGPPNVGQPGVGYTPATKEEPFGPYI